MTEHARPWWHDCEDLGMVEAPDPPPARARVWPAPDEKRRGIGLFQPWGRWSRYERRSIVCTCVYHFAAGMDMVRSVDPDCPWPEHRRLGER